MNKIKLTGTVLAMTAATVFSFAPTIVTAEQSANVSCAGINACKGQSACKTANNSCKGRNSCAGKGILMVTTKESCKAVGGTAN